MIRITLLSCTMLPLPLLQFEVGRWLDVFPAGVRPWIIPAAIALPALILVRAVWRGLARRIQRLHPPAIHPKLQKYNVDHAKLDRQRRALAAGIVATSTGARLAGFRIVRQVEAVFVEGHRTPEEAVTALKAAAAERGANALVNVRNERTTAGKCSASGDAVVAAPFTAKPPPRPTPPADGKTTSD